MAVAYRGGYNNLGAANQTSYTWYLSGTNAVAGDFAICVWYSRASTRTVTVSGPTLITSQDASTANGGHIWVGYKVVTAADVSAGNVGTWTASSVTNGTVGCIVAVFTKVDTTAGITHYATPTAGGAGDPDPPAINTTAGNALIAIFGEMDQNDGVLPPTNFTMAANAAWSTTSGTDGSSGVAYDLDGGTGSSVNPAVFTTTTDSYWYTTVIEIAPQTPPSVTLDDPTDGQTVASHTPALKFTGTDDQSNKIEYHLQVDSTNTFDSQTGSTQIDQSYDVQSSTLNMYLFNGYPQGGSESFVSTGGVLQYVQFYLSKTGAPTGNAVAKIYNSAAGIPTGSALATSDNFDVSTLTTSLALKTLNFSGANQITLARETTYCVAIEYGAAGSSNTVCVNYAYDGNSGYTGGIMSTLTTNAWSNPGFWDLTFFVYIQPKAPIIEDKSTVNPVNFGVTNTSSKQIENQSGDGWSDIASTIYKGLGESFTVGTYGMRLMMIRFVAQYYWGYGPPSPAVTIRCKVYTASGDAPSALVATSTTTYSTDDIIRADGGGSPNYSTLEFAFDQILAPNTKYVFVVILDSTISGTYLEGLTNSTSTYSGGCLGRWNSNDSYTTQSTAESYFEIWGTDGGLFDSGTQITYTCTNLSSGTYYWHVRGKDPGGSNTYGNWPTTQTFIVPADYVPRNGFVSHQNPGLF